MEKDRYSRRTKNMFGHEELVEVRWICECGCSNSIKRGYCRDCGDVRYEKKLYGQV